MAEQTPILQTFNRGIISRYALARTDIQRVEMSAETMKNWMPRALGPMSLRPGLQYVGDMGAANTTGRLLPWIESGQVLGLLALTSGAMRITSSEIRSYQDTISVLSSLVNPYLSTSPWLQATSWSVLGGFTTNTEFGSNLTGWTDGDGVNATSTATSVRGTVNMALAGSQFTAAQRSASSTDVLASSDIVLGRLQESAGVSGFYVGITAGRVSMQVQGNGDTGSGDLVPTVLLSPGSYHVGFALNVLDGETDTGLFQVNSVFSAVTEYWSGVDYCRPSTAAVISIPTTWIGGELDDLRYDQLDNEMYVTSVLGGKPKVIRRLKTVDTLHASKGIQVLAGWGVVDYDPLDGPFDVINTTPFRITPGGKSGNITLSFDSGIGPRTGELFKITSRGQEVSETFTTGNQFSDAIRVTGVDEGRKFRILVDNLSTESSGTIVLQRSVGVEGNWTNVSSALSLIAKTTVDSTFDDTFDNQIIFYRIGFESSGWPATTSTDASASLSFPFGGQEGIVRYNGGGGLDEVIDKIGSTEATELWKRQAYGTNEFPTAVQAHEGRLMLAGSGFLLGSIPGKYESFDEDAEGDSGPIVKDLGVGVTDTIQWMESLNRLIIGAPDREKQAKTSNFDEPLSPTNFAVREIANQGSAAVEAVRIGGRCYFVQSGGKRLYEVMLGDRGDYEVVDRTSLAQEIGEPAITRLAVQRQPDTRIHAMRSDGTVAILVSDPTEDVSGWMTLETNGLVEDIAITPAPAGSGVSDRVYYLVRREIGGSTKLFIEQWAEPEESRGGSTTKLFDAGAQYNSAASTGIITGATHLEGATNVFLWAATSTGGFALGPYTVTTGGVITSSACSTTFYYGLGYDALYKSAKLAYAVEGGGAGLTAKTNLDYVGLVLADTHIQGLQYGQTTDALRDLPLGGYGSSVSTDTVFAEYDHETIQLPGGWDTDSRLVLYAPGGKPTTVMAAVLNMEAKPK